jgi:hypothetical protein
LRSGALQSHKRPGNGSHTGFAAQARGSSQFWTFQRNAQARRFHEAEVLRWCGRLTARNEEKEPDALYLWTRD